MSRDAELVSALQKSRALHQSFGDQHMAKDPPQREKALTNYTMVDIINRALLAED